MPDRDEIPPSEFLGQKGISSSTENAAKQYKAMGRLLIEKLLDGFISEEVVLHSDFQRKIEHVRFDQNERGAIICLLREAGYLAGVDGLSWQIRKE